MLILMPPREGRSDVDGHFCQIYLSAGRFLLLLLLRCCFEVSWERPLDVREVVVASSWESKCVRSARVQVVD